MCVCVCVFVCSFACSRVVSITSSCIVGILFGGNDIKQDDVSRVRTMSLGQNSRSQLALNVCSF